MEFASTDRLNVFVIGFFSWLNENDRFRMDILIKQLSDAVWKIGFCNGSLLRKVSMLAFQHICVRLAGCVNHRLTSWKTQAYHRCSLFPVFYQQWKRNIDKLRSSARIIQHFTSLDGELEAILLLQMGRSPA